MSLTATRALTLLNLLAVAGVAYLWVDQQGKFRNISWATPAAVNPVIAAPPMLVKPGVTDPAAFLATLERPVFAPDRRPPPPPPPVLPPPPPDPLADAQLLGLVAGEAGGIIIRAEGKVRRVRLSQKLGDWTLQSIAERTAIFFKADETRVVHLKYARLNTPVPAAVSQAVPAAVNQAAPVVGGAQPQLSVQRSEAMARQAQDIEDRIRRRAEYKARAAQ